MLSGFFSGLEAAFLSVNGLRLRHLIEEKVINAVLLKKLKDNSREVIIALLIGNNLVNIGASALATVVAVNLFGNAGVGIATGIMTFIVLIVGEIIPKTLAMRHGEKICLKTTRLINMLVIILKPLIWIFKSITKLATGKDTSDKKPIVTEEEIRTFVNIGEQTGNIEADEKEMIDNIFKLNDLEVKDIMTPKIKFISVEADKKIEDLKAFFAEVNHSRLPIFDSKNNKYIGICYVKDIIKLAFDNDTNKKIKELAVEPMYVPETKKIDELLPEFQKQKRYLALVVDEFGEVSGLITIEDLIEEIVGEIYDETDVEHKMVVATEKNTFLIKGEAALHEIEKDTGINLQNGADVATIAGYITNHLGKIPEELDKLETEEFDIVILKMHENRIVEVRMILKK